MEHKDREPGYYWVTWEEDERTIGNYRDGWWLIPTDNMCEEGDDRITNINEKRITEDGIQESRG